MKDLIQELLPVILTMLLILGTSVWVLIKAPIKTFFKLMLIPGAVIASGVIPILFSVMMGRSVQLPLPDEFIALSHRVVVVDSKKKSIEIWLQEKNDSNTRLHITPYSRELEELLEQAKEGRKFGNIAYFQYGKQIGFKIILLSPRQLHPKDP